MTAGATVREPWRLSAAEAAALIARGELTSEALVAACLARIADREPAVRAWAHLDPDAALAEARERDRERPRGPLHGVPVGVKDIIDTAHLPTECGTPAHAGRRPARDATCVTRLREAGAVVLGKTVTTELATYQPAATFHELYVRAETGLGAETATGVQRRRPVRTGAAAATATQIMRP